MLSGGVLPYRGESKESQGTTKRERVEWEHCYLPLPDLTQYNPRLNRPVVDVVVKAMSKKTNQRYLSTLELLQDFERAQSLQEAPKKSYGSVDDTILTTENVTQKFTKKTFQNIPPFKPLTHPVTTKGAYLIGYSGEWDGQVIQINSPEFKIGRGPQNHLRLADKTVSRNHATIIRSRTGLVIRDDGSKLGTLINDIPIVNPISLHNGDTIRIASFVFVFRE
jgi:hypothetical protein